MSVQEIQKVLEERAQRLARPAKAESRADAIEVVVFALAAELYAVEATRVREVFRLQARSSLPGARDPIVGITSHRGELLTLLDLRSGLGLSHTALNDLARVVVIERGRTRVGVLVDRVEGVKLLDRERLHPPPPHGPARREYLMGITNEATVVLNVDEVLRLFDGGNDR